ncbi:MAG: ATP-binding protein [Saccharofermentans sp.]|nr:ATP-binding protein [Saccharofermentans sp.]
MNIKPTVKIQQLIFTTMLMMASFLILIIAVVSIVFNIRSEQKNIDDNLKNVASAIAASEFVGDMLQDNESGGEVAAYYFNHLKDYLTNVDVISVVSKDGIRRYHTNSEYIGSVYDGTIPNFGNNGRLYTTSDVGPSGSQRRAYAAVYDSQGNYIGFVLVVMLNQNINRIVGKTVIIHVLAAVVTIVLCAVLSIGLSRKIKSRLRGYEPDTFSAMYSIRDTIIESLNEGVVAISKDKEVMFMNSTARRILGDVDSISDNHISLVLSTGENILGINIKSANGTEAILNFYPIKEDEEVIGVLCVIADRTEYTKMMEDLTGVNYLVDSMRANNHDFTNKLHVILGLIQMENYDQACSYISDVTMTKQVQLSNIMRYIKEPAIAALLIGKQARAAELDITFALENGSSMEKNSINFPMGDLITIIGNLIENSMDAIDTTNREVKNITVGIFGSNDSLLIKIDDSGPGIPDDLLPVLFDKGITTKGTGRGTGLYVVKKLVDKLGGSITVESETGEGTLISVWISSGGNKNV